MYIFSLEVFRIWQLIDCYSSDSSATDCYSSVIPCSLSHSTLTLLFSLESRKGFKISLFRKPSNMEDFVCVVKAAML